jgi:hypothetical protein
VKEKGFNTPIAYLFYARPKHMEVTFPLIRQLRPRRLYLIADGPKGPSDTHHCIKAKKFVEKKYRLGLSSNEVLRDEEHGFG